MGTFTESRGEITLGLSFLLCGMRPLHSRPPPLHGGVQGRETLLCCAVGSEEGTAQICIIPGSLA